MAELYNKEDAMYKRELHANKKEESPEIELSPKRERYREREREIVKKEERKANIEYSPQNYSPEGNRFDKRRLPSTKKNEKQENVKL